MAVAPAGFPRPRLLRESIEIQIFHQLPKRGHFFYEKVIKVKADAAALLMFDDPQHPPSCLSSSETLLIFFCVAQTSAGALRGCQGRRRMAAFILTLDSLATHFTIELGTKRNAVQ